SAPVRAVAARPPGSTGRGASRRGSAPTDARLPRRRARTRGRPRHARRAAGPPVRGRGTRGPSGPSRRRCRSRDGDVPPIAAGSVGLLHRCLLDAGRGVSLTYGISWVTAARNGTGKGNERTNESAEVRVIGAYAPK